MKKTLMGAAIGLVVGSVLPWVALVFGLATSGESGSGFAQLVVLILGTPAVLLGGVAGMAIVGARLDK
jgi:hypothetical protein